MNTALLLLPDFTLILLGTAIRRWMHLGDHFWNGVEKLVYFILFPALLINAIVKTRLDLGAALPLLVAAAAPERFTIPAVGGASLLLLALLGGLAARAGGAPMATAAARVAFWGALAMGVTAGVGALLGTVV